LHVPVMKEAIKQGIPLAVGQPVPWLSGRGHLDHRVHESAPGPVLSALAGLHATLGGDAGALAGKVLRNPPIPDLVHVPTGCLIEVDELQHFSTARLLTFDAYPAATPLGFVESEYRALCGHLHSKADRAFAHRVSADFPFVGGRQAQRAYNDALRDLLAPSFTGYPVIRIAAPDRNVRAAADALEKSLKRYLGTG
jgi:hypothetical protein